MINNIIELDNFSNIFVSVYLVREIINIAPILKYMLGRESIYNLTERLFGHLMALR
jgi:hypothetical protein